MLECKKLRYFISEMQITTILNGKAALDVLAPHNTVHLTRCREILASCSYLPWLLSSCVNPYYIMQLFALKLSQAT